MVLVGETLTPEIRVIDNQGGLLREISWTPAERDPKETMEDVLAAALEDAGPQSARRIRQEFAAVPVPEGVPVFKTFMVDAGGFIWVRPYEPLRDAPTLGGYHPRTNAGGVWWVFSWEGERVGSIEVPSGLEPYQITLDALVGIRRDPAFGVEHVQVHRLYRR